MKAEVVQRQLNAGGFVAANVKCDAKLTETMVARTYGSPALGERVVVRLSSDRLVPAEDLAMEFLGLEGRAVSEVIAKQNRTALDFAHWALINQPDNAKFALELVKRMKAAARKAASKPGHAWDAYSEMAETLNKTVRHFLPPFWEQAARAFKELGNQTYAGRALNKALEAERVHALKVDREHRRDAVLEFSLSGCLSGKAISDYSKDLEKQFEPAEAYDTYKDLVIRRTLGGMPPTATVAADLARMGKAAKLNVDKEIESVLEAMVASPAMVRAPMQFWKSVKKQVHNIVARNEPFAVWLLVHTNFSKSYYSDSGVWQWIDLLDEWGVLPYLSKPAEQMPKGVEIPGGRVGWISKLANIETSPDKRILELLEAMAETLKAEGKPIDLSGAGWSHQVDVDVLEACLDLGLEVKVNEERFDLDFSGWLRSEVDHTRRNSQLTHVTSDARFANKLQSKIPSLVNFKGTSHSKQSYGRQLATQRSFEEAAAGHPAMREAWWKYLDCQLSLLENGAMVDVESALNALRECSGPKTATEFPEYFKRLKAVDIVAALQRTLVAGVFDEYGWAELDRLDDEKRLPIQTKRHTERHSWLFPRFAYFQDDEVVVVDAEKSSKPRPCKLTQKQTFQAAVPVGDDVLIIYVDSDDSWKSTMRWLSEPDKNYLQPEYFYTYHNTWLAIAPVKGTAGYFLGSRSLQPGDKTLPRSNMNWFHDGERFWRMKEGFHALINQGKPGLTEVDPQSGKELRDSVPSFFETDLPAGSRIQFELTYLQPMTTQAGVSPLGSRDGLVGWRVVRRRDGAYEGVGIDGRKWVFDLESQPGQGVLAATGMLDKPAAKSHWVLANDGRLIDSETGVAFGRYHGRDAYFAGQPVEYPTIFLNHLRLRCEKSSKLLRETTYSQAAKLLEAGAIEHAALKIKEDPAKLDPNRQATLTAVKKWLDKAPARLAEGVARIARIAAEEHVSWKATIERVEKVEKPKDEIQFDLAKVNEGLECFALVWPEGIHHYGHRDNIDNGSHILAVSKFFAGGEGGQLPITNKFWIGLISDTPTEAWKCFWRVATAETEQRLEARLKSPFLDALAFIGETKLCDREGSFAYYITHEAEDAPTTGPIRSQLTEQHPFAFVEGDCRYIAYIIPHYYKIKQIMTLAYSAKGKLKPPKDFTIQSSHEFKPAWNDRTIASFVKAARSLQALPLPTSEELAAGSSKLGVHPITLALTWMGNLRTSTYGQEKLTEELRGHYGWKVKDIQVALAELAAANLPADLCSVGIREYPASGILAGREKAFQHLVTKWHESFKVGAIQLPAELAKELERINPGYYKIPTKMVSELLSSPTDCELFRTTKVKIGPKKEQWSPLEVVYDPPHNRNFHPVVVFPRLIKTLSVINYLLPVGDPIRKRLPEVIEAGRAFLNNPETAFAFGAGMTEYPGDKVDAAATLAKLATALGSYETSTDGIHRFDDGLIFGGSIPPHVSLVFRSSKLTDDQAYARVAAAAALTIDYSGPGNSQCLEFVRKLRGETMSQLIADNRDSKLPVGSWEQDPRLSVPDIVQSCMKKFGLSENAAALYLQTLALADPTTANIRQWNSWSPKILKDAVAELIAGEQVVEAKRERAGREIFLPGGWEALKAPNLPIESWKLAMFGFKNTDPLRGSQAEYIVCEGSIRVHFHNAWQRIEKGDMPQYEQAVASKKKK